MGFAAGHASDVVLWRALVIMIPCWFIGRVVGGLAVHVMESQIRQYKKTRPIPPDYQVGGGNDILDVDDLGDQVAEDSHEQIFVQADTQPAHQGDESTVGTKA